MIDPIDGTYDYLNNKEEFTLNAGLIINKKPEIAIINAPAKKRLFYTFGINNSFELKDIDYMKIDVEGFELPVLQGAVKTIRESKPFIHVEMKTKRMLDKREDFEKFFKMIDYKMILRTGSEELYYI